MSTTRVEIVTPTKKIDVGEVSYLRAPSTDGLFGVLPNHAKSVITLDVGEIAVTKNGKKEYYATSGGFAEIYGDHILLLVETAEPASEIDKVRAEEAVKRAKERLKNRTDDTVNTDRAALALSKALNRLTISNR